MTANAHEFEKLFRSALNSTKIYLDPEYKKAVYSGVLRYLAERKSSIDPCLYSLELYESPDDAWFSLESDGTVDVQKGKRYVLDHDSIINLMYLMPPYCHKAA